MKLKHIIILILIVLIAGAVFYFGWIQIKLPENSYGVVFTKSNGYLDRVYKPGEFSWNYRKLIPTNFSLNIIPVTLRTIKSETAGILPSGKIYSEFLPGNPEFSFRFNYTIGYRLKPEALPMLLKDKGLRPDNLEIWYEETDSAIIFKTDEFLKNKSRLSASKLFYESVALQTETIQALENAFPYLEFLDFIPTGIATPDTALYEKGKELYLESVEADRRVNAGTKAAIEAQKIRDAANFDTLRKYGELLKEYPSLIEFFEVIDFDSSTVFPELPNKPAGENE